MGEISYLPLCRKCRIFWSMIPFEWHTCLGQIDAKVPVVVQTFYFINTAVYCGCLIWKHQLDVCTHSTEHFNSFALLVDYIQYGQYCQLFLQLCLYKRHQKCDALYKRHHSHWKYASSNPPFSVVNLLFISNFMECKFWLELRILLLRTDMDSLWKGSILKGMIIFQPLIFQGKLAVSFRYTPLKLTWIPKEMVWKGWFLLIMAMLVFRGVSLKFHDPRNTDSGRESFVVWVLPVHHSFLLGQLEHWMESRR